MNLPSRTNENMAKAVFCFESADDYFKERWAELNAETKTVEAKVVNKEAKVKCTYLKGSPYFEGCNKSINLVRCAVCDDELCWEHWLEHTNWECPLCERIPGCFSNHLCRYRRYVD